MAAARFLVALAVPIPQPPTPTPPHTHHFGSLGYCRTVHACAVGLQGEKFLDSLDDVAMPGVILLDGMAIWGPPKSVGITPLKLWLAAWLQQYGVNAAITASTVTPYSNKVGTGGAGRGL